MLDLPDRLESMMRKIEAGEPVTSQDLNRIASLQSIDIVRLGRQAAKEAFARNEEQLSLLDVMTSK